MNIYVGNLSLEITGEEVRQEFTAFGEVTKVTIMNDKYIGSGQPRGYGFVEMASKARGEAAITGLNGRSLKGRVINVVEAIPLTDERDIGLLDKRRTRRFNRRSRQRES